MDGVEQRAGVYVLIFDGEISYIGTSDNVRKRLQSHGLPAFHETGLFKGRRYASMEIKACYIDDEKTRLAVEKALIEMFRPECNSEGDGRRKIRYADVPILMRPDFRGGKQSEG